MDYKSTAKQIVKAVGGKRNVKEASQCATRLRFRLKEEGKIDHEAMKHIEGVAAAFIQGKEYQVLPKEGTSEIYQEIVRPSIGKKLFGDFWS